MHRTIHKTFLKLFCISLLTNVYAPLWAMEEDCGAYDSQEEKEKEYEDPGESKGGSQAEVFISQNESLLSAFLLHFFDGTIGTIEFGRCQAMLMQVLSKKSLDQQKNILLQLSNHFSQICSGLATFFSNFANSLILESEKGEGKEPQKRSEHKNGESKEGNDDLDLFVAALVMQAKDLFGNMEGSIQANFQEGIRTCDDSLIAIVRKEGDYHAQKKIFEKLTAYFVEEKPYLANHLNELSERPRTTMGQNFEECLQAAYVLEPKPQHRLPGIRWENPKKIKITLSHQEKVAVLNIIAENLMVALTNGIVYVCPLNDVGMTCFGTNNDSDKDVKVPVYIALGSVKLPQDALLTARNIRYKNIYASIIESSREDTRCFVENNYCVAGDSQKNIVVYDTQAGTEVIRLNIASQGPLISLQPLTRSTFRGAFQNGDIIEYFYKKNKKPKKHTTTVGHSIAALTGNSHKIIALLKEKNALRILKNNIPEESDIHLGKAPATSLLMHDSMIMVGFQDGHASIFQDNDPDPCDIRIDDAAIAALYVLDKNNIVAHAADTITIFQSEKTISLEDFIEPQSPQPYSSSINNSELRNALSNNNGWH